MTTQVSDSDLTLSRLALASPVTLVRPCLIVIHFFKDEARQITTVGLTADSVASQSQHLSAT